MKKLVCTLLALAMLCSFTVVNVSAANTYEGEMFKIESDYEIDFYGGLESHEGDEYYLYGCYIEELDSEIEIDISDMDYMLGEIQYDFPEVDTCKEYYEIYKDYAADEKEVLIDGVPAFVHSGDNDTTYFIEIWSDNYYFSIDLEACDEESRDALYDLFVEGFEITDSTSWYSGDDADVDDEDDSDKADKDSKDEKADDKEDKAEKDNTVIIIAAVIAGVVVIAVVAIIVLGKKKKA